MDRTTIPGDIDRAVDALAGPNGAQVVTEHRARTIATQLAQRAFAEGQRAAIRELHTTDDAAAALGVTRQYVNRLASRHDVGWHIGRDRLFRPDDIEALRGVIAAAVRTGRPRRAAQ